MICSTDYLYDVCKDIISVRDGFVIENDMTVKELYEKLTDIVAAITNFSETIEGE